WAQTSVEGWGPAPGFDSMMPDLMRVVASRNDSPAFLAELDGKAIAAASMVIHEGVALLAGACTIPKCGCRGAQHALFHARLEHARTLGCNLEMMCAAEAGGESQRNAERSGFRVAYTRTKWGLDQQR